MALSSYDREPVFGTETPAILYTDRRAAYLVVKENGKFAAVEANGKYFLPGGGTHIGESAEQTVVREVFEELACQALIIRPIGDVTQYFYAFADGCHYRMHATFFLGGLAEPAAGVGEHTLHWISNQDAQQPFFHECHEWATRQV